MAPHVFWIDVNEYLCGDHVLIKIYHFEALILIWLDKISTVCLVGVQAEPNMLAR